MNNRLCDLMVSVFASNVVDRAYESRSCQTNDYKLVFVASPLNTHHQGVRAKTGWLGIRIMCPSEATVHCCFNELTL